MGSLKLALEQGAPKRLELTWGLRYGSFDAKLDGQVVASAQDAAELRNGVSGRLPDGSTLEVKLTNNMLQQKLVVLRDGQPVPGSATHPLTQVRSAAHALYLVAGLSVLLGLYQISRGGEENLYGGIGTFVAAGLLGLLGFLAMRPSFVAIVLGMVLLAVDGVFSLIDQLEGGRPNVMGVLIRILILVILFNGAKGARALRAQPAAPVVMGG